MKRKNSDPTLAMYRAVAPAPTRNGSVSRRTGSIRALGEVRSLRRNTRNSTRARPRQALVGAAPQPTPGPRVSPTTNASTVPVPSTEASTGIRSARGWSPAEVTQTAAPKAHRMVSGTLTTKTSRHDTVVSRPPRMAPAASPSAPTAPQTARALLRDGPAGKVVPMRARTAGCSTAAPRPWAPRAASSTDPSPAVPPTALATPKVTMATMNSRLAPTRSDRRPPTTRNPAKSTA